MNYATKPIPPEKPPVAQIVRPWGSFKQYAFNEETTVSLMTVLPGQRLSLQAHSGRAELWIVLDAGAEVQVGDASRICAAGEEIWIPAHERHRLGNPGEPRPGRVSDRGFATDPRARTEEGQVLVTGTYVRTGRAFEVGAEEVHRLLHVRHRDLGVQVQVGVKARGPTLAGPDDEQVRHLPVS